MLSIILIVLALAIAAQAKPVSFPTEKSFSLPVSRNPSHVPNGTAALLQTYRKFNIKPTLNMRPEFMSALSSLDVSSGSAPAFYVLGDQAASLGQPAAQHYV